MRTMLAMPAKSSRVRAPRLGRRTRPCDSRLIPQVMANQDFAIADGCGNSNVKKTAEYFVPRLVTPIYGCIWIGVVRVVGRIIVPSDRPHLSPFFEKAWL